MNSNQNSAPIIEIGEANFKSEVLQSKLPVLVAFWAPWSRPCQIFSSALDAVATECAASVKVVKVNADDDLDLSLVYEIQSIPTLLFFVDGSLRARAVGTASKEAILSKWQSLLPGRDFSASTHDSNQEPELHPAPADHALKTSSPHRQ